MVPRLPHWVVGIASYRLPYMLDFMLSSLTKFNNILIYVSDDGSPESEYEQIKAICWKYDNVYFDWNRPLVNLGLSYTTNRILDYARNLGSAPECHYVAILNNDLYFNPEIPLFERLAALINEGYTCVSPSVWGLSPNWDCHGNMRHYMKEFKKGLSQFHDKLYYYEMWLRRAYRAVGGFEHYSRKFYEARRGQLCGDGIAGSFIAMSINAARRMPDLPENMPRAEGQDMVIHEWGKQRGKGNCSTNDLYVHHWCEIRKIVNNIRRDSHDKGTDSLDEFDFSGTVAPMFRD